MFEVTPVHWVGFLVLVLVLLLLDLGVLNRKAHVISLREAAATSAIWVALSLGFNGLVWALMGEGKAIEFFTAYLIEKSLSIDNIFVFIVLFEFFRVPPEYQHRVLFWGILGALVTRGAFIFAGTALLHRFHVVVYLFGAILVFTALRLAFQKAGPIQIERKRIVRWVQKLLPVAPEAPQGQLFCRYDGKVWVTPLFLTLVTIELTDIVFAVDSIPAVLAITDDEFIVFTSYILAILGLRALYFLLAGAMHRFRYLKVGLAAILLFVGAKMLASDLIKVPNGVSLLVIAVVLAVTIGASLGSRPASPG